MKITHKLVICFLLIALVVWIAGYFAIHQSQAILKAYIGKKSAAFAVEVLKQIDKELGRNEEIFDIYIKNRRLKEFVIASNTFFGTMADVNSYIDRIEKDWVSASNTATIPIITEILSNDLSKELIEKVAFYEKKHNRKVFGEVFVTNKYGANIAQTGKTTDYKQNDEFWWRKTKEDGVYFSNIIFDESADVYSIDIGLRITDDTGDFIGVIKIVLNMEEVIYILNGFKERSGFNTIQVQIINKQGVLLCGDQHKPGQMVYDKNLVKQIKGHYGYFEGTGHQGEPVLFSYANSLGYKSIGGLGWILLAKNQLEEIYEPVNQMKKYIIILPMVLTVLIAIISLYISRSIAVPLSKLSKAAIEIGKGNLDMEIHVTSHDEIGVLADSFKTMTANLKMSTISIDRLNEEIGQRKSAETDLQQRTKELGNRVKELNCLYSISTIVDKPGISLDDVINGALEHIKAAWQYSDVVCVRITINGQVHQTRNFQQTSWAQVCDIRLSDKAIGKIEVFYLVEKPEKDEGPFLKEERILLTAIAGLLGRIIRGKIEKEEKEKLQLQLVQSEKMASIGQLAAGVAHEINNPTGFVSSNLKTLKDYQNDVIHLLKAYRSLCEELKNENPDANDPLTKRLTQIEALEEDVDIEFIVDDIFKLIAESQDGTQRIKKIVEGLKDFAHPGKDKLQYADINKNLDSTINIVWNELKYKATVKKEYGDLPEVQCYPQQINQVFMNLLVNAAQSIEDKGEIKIETKALSGWVEIKISDNGAGIAKENLLKIFNPFFTTKEVGKGTGLGLNLAYNIIEKHNGTIEVESELGQGTTFTIKLKCCSENA